MSALRAAPLGPGQARMNYRFLSEMYQAAYVYQSDFAMWEGLFRLACIIHDQPLDEPICGQIYEKIHQQGAEGDFAGDPVGNLQIARAALALYEYANSRDILKSVLLCCSWISVHWEEVISNNSIRRNPADLMEFLVKVYWYTGKKPILSLCDKLRREAVNWTGLLQTYSIKRPTSMMASWLEMRAGIDREADADEGQYVRQYMLTHAETLADGLRATSMNAIYSGSGDEAQAAKNGWGRISHWHGAVCGGTTADESVQGNDPSIAIDGASVCAWGEAFLVQFLQDDASWAIDEFDKLLHNAIPATIVAGRLTPYQRVNMVEKTPLIRECYHTHPSDEQRKRVLVRLCRVAARAASSVVMTTPHGADVILYVSGLCFCVPCLLSGRPVQGYPTGVSVVGCSAPRTSVIAVDHGLCNVQVRAVGDIAYQLIVFRSGTSAKPDVFRVRNYHVVLSGACTRHAGDGGLVDGEPSGVAVEGCVAPHKSVRAVFHGCGHKHFIAVVDRCKESVSQTCSVPPVGTSWIWASDSATFRRAK